MTTLLTLIDGPTLLIELGGLRILTDPTFAEPQVFTSGEITVIPGLKRPHFSR